MTDYRSSVFLPQTDFPMKAGLPGKEPQLLARWQANDLFGRLRAQSKGKEKFVLHDGPPYANGNIHIGTALNKILKDVVNRSQQMQGKDAHYVPGWDCHGLPIEWKIEEQYRAAGKNKDDVPIIEFRKECREFAERWITIQMAEFQRLGITGDWSRYYSTMAYEAEAVIANELGKFLLNGSLYKGSKAVMWSVVEKTALAEAEVEYHDKTSTTIHVAFPVLDSPNPALLGASVVIWTTTPWTIPGNRAVAYGEAIDYGLYRVVAVEEKALVQVGRVLVLARNLADDVARQAKVELELVDEVSGFAGTILAHPWRGQGYDFDVPMLPGAFVADDTGTGFVHIAPGHGADDFELGRTHGIAVPDTVDEGGEYYPTVPIFAGKHVFKVDGDVCDALIQADALLARGKLTHSYPHSWRSKAPLIFRNAAQWFISMETNDLRRIALKAIDDTAFFPAKGQRRLHAMIESRPDWCVSRQRAWGVPITVFVDKRTNQPLRDPAVMARIVEAFRAEGGDAWFSSDPKRFLGDQYDPADFEQVRDILDVWFDSGSTHAFVLEGREDLAWPASLYLEGSDQHRGWFHSSLLESCGTRGRAPYQAVLTHGFVMDGDGRKMSKSLGNVIAPQSVCDEFGADILRLWIVSQDYTEDLKIDKKILQGQVDSYRRLRNSLRYLLGALAGFSEAERLPYEQMPELERWVLHRLNELSTIVRTSAASYDFHSLFSALHQFCAVDLSAFYFDIRKDTLYCDPVSSLERRACRTVFDLVFDHLCTWLAPVLVFTAEEAWLQRHGDSPENSVHLQVWRDVPGNWSQPQLAEKWAQIRDVRRVVTGALEIARAEKKIGASLQAAPDVFVPAAAASFLDGIDLADVCITSGVRVRYEAVPDDAFKLADVAEVGCQVQPAIGHKCGRCWQVLPEVGRRADHPELCERCYGAVTDVGQAA